MSDVQATKPGQVSDRAKLQFDFFKHLTTLASGGAAFQIAVVEKFNIQFSAWTTVALFGFGACVLGSFVEMAYKCGVCSSKRSTDLEGSFGGLLSCLAFLVGCIGFVFSLQK